MQKAIRDWTNGKFIILLIAQGSDCQINKTSFPGQTTDNTNRKSTSEIEEDQCREPKRLKLNSGPSCEIMKTYLDEKSKGFGRQHVQQGVATFNLESEDQVITHVTPSSEPKKFTSNPDFTCAFCHSSKDSEVIIFHPQLQIVIDHLAIFNHHATNFRPLILCCISSTENL